VNIIQVLQQLRRGKTLSEIDDALAEATRAVREHGGSAEVTVKFKVKRFNKSIGKEVIVSDVISSKLPKPDRADTLFFSTETGGLSRNDPDQRQLPGVAEVDKNTGEIIERGVVSNG